MIDKTVPFTYNGKKYYAELWQGCGWLISDYNRNGVDVKKRVYNFFYKRLLPVIDKASENAIVIIQFKPQQR